MLLSESRGSSFRKSSVFFLYIVLTCFFLTQRVRNPFHYSTESGLIKLSINSESYKVHNSTLQDYDDDPPTLDNGRSPHGYINQRLQVQFGALDDERYADRNMLILQ
jgi:hypothetical protein